MEATSGEAQEARRLPGRGNRNLVESAQGDVSMKRRLGNTNQWSFGGTSNFDIMANSLLRFAVAVSC